MLEKAQCRVTNAYDSGEMFKRQRSASSRNSLVEKHSSSVKFLFVNHHLGDVHLASPKWVSQL